MHAFPNRRLKSYRTLFARLPAHIQKQANKAFELWQENHNHPSLRLHTLDVKAQVVEDSISVSFGSGYRAIARVDHQHEMILWYWVGSHSDYNVFTGKK